MGIATGYTAEHMDQIQASCVVSGEVQGDELILTTFGGTTIDAGNVRGPKGDKGDQGIQGIQGPGTATDQQVADFVNQAGSLSQLAVDARVDHVQTVTDWNAATVPGQQYYSAAGAANTPTALGMASGSAATDRYAGRVYADPTAGAFGLVQVAYLLSDTNNPQEFIRKRSNIAGAGVWSAWRAKYWDSGWQTMPLASGMAANASDDIPKYKVENGWFRAKGSIARSNSAAFQLSTAYILSGVLPAWALPASTTDSQSFLGTSNADSQVRAYVSSITAQLNINLSSDASASYINLNGLNYPTVAVV